MGVLPQSNYERVSCEYLSLIFMHNHNIEITEQYAASAHRQTDEYPHRLLSFSVNLSTKEFSASVSYFLE